MQAMARQYAGNDELQDDPGFSMSNIDLAWPMTSEIILKTGVETRKSQGLLS